MPSIVRNILALFTERDRVRFARVTGAVVVSAVLETVTVLAVLPFMTVVADPETVFGVGVVARLYAAVGSPERATFLLMMGGAVLGLVVLSNAMSAMVTWRLGRFVWDKYHDLAGRLLLTYLRQPYPFFLGRNSADLSKNILSEVEVAMTGVVIPVLYTFARGILALFILCLLFAVDAQVALVAVTVVGGSYAATYAVLRGRLGRFGQARLDANEQRFQAAAEALSGVKAVKILGREEAFLGRFLRPSEVFAKATANREVLSVVPRYVLEAVAFGGITALMMVVLLRPGGPETVLPTLALYGFAGLKLMPALQQVFASFATSRFYAPALARLREELERGEPAPPTSEERDGERFEAGEGDAVVALKGLSYRYPGASASSLHDVTLEVRRGGVYGFVGRTGSGKTTAMDVVLGLLPPSEGEVRVLGRPLVPGIADAWRRRVGYVPQDIFLTDESIASNVALGEARPEIDRDRVRAVVDLVELTEMVDGLPEGIDTEVGERGVRLSGGQRQRIGIARALYLQPDVLVFDEGTSALDSATEGAILGRLGGLGVTVLWVTHRLSTARGFDRIFVFADGRLVGDGTHEELLAGCAEYRRLAGTEAPPSVGATTDGSPV